ncbi:septum formation inhibitor Maf [Spongiibacter sp. KMU-166]|uniref:7-methyl-GTP pyrophosphatase n=1 Tax=Spongiibacter thalassae TaxID=2721624 RepID=A0ABX1GDQ3_9GAMM|nr:nucleoside triphosphate pyrophosphatase [Spongiibacter thalassae]NKI17315.1 septum formation inhibitor Maf [Spongiibacter thalassae]
MTQTPTPSIILASGSSYRRALLEKIGLAPEIQPANIDETPAANEPPATLALRLAREKAAHVAQSRPAGLIIGSDQVADLNGSPLGKPGTAANAIEQLHSCSGQTVIFHTGLCVINAQTGRIQQSCEQVAVHFRTLSSEQIKRYVAAEPALDCAGSFKAEGLGITLFHRIEGTDPNTLIGLPIIRLVEFLANEGVALP